MKNLSLFQIGALVIAIALAVVGVLVFATLGGAFGQDKQVGVVIIWGTEDGSTMQSVIAKLAQSDKSLTSVQYVEKDPSTYENDLINALASGQAPDLALLPVEDIYSFRDKILTIPYSSMSQSSYQSAFLNEGQLFLTPQGELALPFLIDPLVMYWNRDLLAGAGIAEPPTLWNDVVAEAPSLIKKDASGNIQKSAVAMGSWSNVRDARAILSALIMQAGDPIVDDTDGSPSPTLGSNPSQATEIPASSALRFYTDFANPSKTVYSWNRSQPNSQDAFAAGDLALYFGLGSEESTIAARNPNLNFAVAPLPQPQGASVAITYGELTGLAIPRGAKNPNGALYVAEKLSSQAGASAAASAFHMPPVRRDLLAAVPNDAAQTTLNQSALVARGFLNPDPSKTDGIFSTMIQSVVSGEDTPSEAVGSAAQSFYRLFPLQGASTQ